MINDNDVKLIEKFIEIRNKGHFCDGTHVTDVYNRVLNKNLRPSNCSSCIRQRIGELEVALKAHKQALEALKEKEVDNASTEENNAAGEAENKSVKKAGRPKKN